MGVCTVLLIEVKLQILCVLNLCDLCILDICGMINCGTNEDCA